MTASLVIFPHQLFAEHPGLQESVKSVVLIEEPLFFGEDRYFSTFHKQKLWLHRATMTRYKARLEKAGRDVVYVSHKPETSMLSDTVADLKSDGVETLVACDPVDFLVEKRLRAAAQEAGLDLRLLPSPGFINSTADNKNWASGRKRWFMAEFYKYQRRRLDVMMDGDEPAGGRWSFDEDNRKKVPKSLMSELPQIPSFNRDHIDLDARMWVEDRFPGALGSLETLYVPTSHDDAQAWLHAFLEHRFELFGDYEDAIVEGESWLWHSVLTPMLNIGLLTPEQILRAVLDHVEKHAVPLNSQEGFIRQIIGWREFMRATYEDLGVTMRTTNHWNHRRPIPASFYDGTTGIAPVDDVIGRVLETGYCHHIERLMVLGGFMFVCEIDPDDIYRWFMEMFVDSYDWVMVPNVYAMSQHADGGLITTKPYFSGSNYVRKMSNHRSGEWADIWDGLYWRFIWKHREALSANPRWSMMCRTVERMDDAKRKAHIARAEAYLNSLS
ncbi:MAG: cryptochrome/photolyase family protein [Pseudomonadota bacterium]